MCAVHQSGRFSVFVFVPTAPQVHAYRVCVRRLNLSCERRYISRPTTLIRHKLAQECTVVLFDAYRYIRVVGVFQS